MVSIRIGDGERHNDLRIEGLGLSPTEVLSRVEPEAVDTCLRTTNPARVVGQRLRNKLPLIIDAAVSCTFTRSPRGR